MIFSNFNGTKSGGPLSWGTRLMEKVILGVAGAVQSAVFAGKQNSTIVYKSVDSSKKNIL